MKTMSAKVTLLFTAKPGKYPAHKGGRSWFHDRGGVRTVLYNGKPTAKVFPRVVIENGQTHEFDRGMAKTLLKRYECWSDPNAKPKADDKPKTVTTKESDA